MARKPVFEGEHDPSVWLDLARASRKEGRFADALRAHRYYHANALAADSGHYGVRLSFALGDWAALARRYPPALKALRRARDQARTAALGLPTGHREGSEAFHEALAIDDALGDSYASYQLIGELEAAHPGNLTGYSDHRVVEVLRSRGEYRRCLTWMGDPDEQFNRAAGLYVQLGGLTGRGSSPKDAGRMFHRQVAQLVETLAGGGRTSTAKRLITAAAKIHPHPAYEHMLDKAREAVLRKRSRN